MRLAICDATIKNEKGKSEKLRRATIILKSEITDESLDDLAKIKSLEHIKIRGNGLTADGVERLKRALPQTVVFR